MLVVASPSSFRFTPSALSSALSTLIGIAMNSPSLSREGEAESLDDVGVAERSFLREKSSPSSCADFAGATTWSTEEEAGLFFEALINSVVLDFPMAMFMGKDFLFVPRHGAEVEAFGAEDVLMSARN